MLKYLNIDIKNALKNNLHDVDYLQKKVTQIHNDVLNKNVAEKDWLGWYDLPNNYNKEEFIKMYNKANEWKKQGIEVVVVIGIGGSYLGAKAGYDFIYGPYSTKKPDIELLFAGNDISSESLVAKLKYVQNKKFAINVISKSGTTLEPSIAFREFRNLLEKNEGENASSLVVATTDKAKGVLFNLAEKKGYQKFIIPDDVGGRFSVLTPVGLFPFMCAGIDALKVLKGAQETNDELSSDKIEQNPAYLYATTRYYLHKEKGFNIEMMVSYEPKLQYFAEWWKQLFAESEGKDGKGIWPTSSIFSTDLHSLGQMIQDGNKILFETVLTLKNPENDIHFSEDAIDFDKLNYLSGNSLHNVNNVAFKATTKAHVEVGKVPNIHLLFDRFNEETLGALFIFFERALTMSAYLLGVNPFNQPGVEVYKKNMFNILEKK
ncbi:glucose-6-phosphate isomerase [Mycoplasmopsis cynos]|uniref:Glucose-6-phosphate isomerase n=2 Tax=Mycoplasmopsis cynos TaxID=171284 RepID=A0A449AIF3_9BACT|nr:glucose-6-phosphate isomerase [Mycoplasmopsis cynos]MCU9933284.1 glucose-6-phosphate isomerase [Mycoplasmopsis cynos]WQQ12784.1 glucose-6-phosphate isomerase [Mycoplasmopsis cynos]WQQ13992.1 glucose-6-phosphate isomerase [Mycoplasmopsis cynos]WQQ14947.1 glucose-6-phosphate isomerase [Mycoplasmopsis cynos]WQQ15540.1 glucose-6-phosphate isomerase [Mycoplasmopsis cynos]